MLYKGVKDVCFIIPEMRIYEGHWQNLQFRKLRHLIEVY